MKNIKIISIFKINEKVPFITCIATDMEQSKDGNYFLSEADGDLDREQMIRSYRRLFSELSGISKVTLNSLMPSAEYVMVIVLSCLVFVT